MRAGRLDSLMWAGIAVGVLYLLARFQQKFEQGLEVAADVYRATRTGTTNLIETFFPLVNPDSMVTYAVTFPDGSRHAVPGETVDKSGYFVYRGARYRLMVNSNGSKIAVTA